MSHSSTTDVTLPGAVPCNEETYQQLPMTGIKPCWICKTRNDITFGRDKDNPMNPMFSAYVRCKQCSVGVFSHETVEKAIMAWNAAQDRKKKEEEARTPKPTTQQYITKGDLLLLGVLASRGNLTAKASKKPRLVDRSGNLVKKISMKKIKKLVDYGLLKEVASVDPMYDEWQLDPNPQ